MPTDIALTKQHSLRFGGVLVTRPQQQADKLAGLIEASGGTAIRVPMLRIEAVQNAIEVNALHKRICCFERLIFTSANAVSHFPIALTPLPARVQLFAIGAATANALVVQRLASCVGMVGVGTGRWNSEALLATATFTDAEILGSRILIAKGEGGRTLLATVLQKRGAAVESIAVYRRVPPPATATAAMLHSHRQNIWAVTITSTQSLHHLFALGCDWIADKVFVVSSERIAVSAQKYGVRRIDVARQVNDEALVDALRQAAHKTIKHGLQGTSKNL